MGLPGEEEDVGLGLLALVVDLLHLGLVETFTGAAARSLDLLDFRFRFRGTASNQRLPVPENRQTKIGQINQRHLIRVTLQLATWLGGSSNISNI